MKVVQVTAVVVKPVAAWQEDSFLIKIRVMKDLDWQAVQRIYAKGIETRNATFETDTPTWEEWDNSHLQHCRYVAVIGEQIIGWAALSPYSRRSVYRGVAELSVYVDTSFNGRGVASMLMETMIKATKEEGYWTLQSAVFPENAASIQLHKKFGFREVGYREKIGLLDGVWRDVVLLERKL
jgi:L-amino acid N-acyltransferase YncA